MVQTQTIPHTSASMLRLGLPIAAALFLIDQVSKWWIINSVMQPPRVIPVTEFFNLVLWHNTGVSFGLFGDTSPWMLMIFTLAMVIGLIIWLMRAANRLTAIALGLIIGGALANILDRLRHGAVTDFLDFYVAAYHWPAFNLADVGIVSGVSLLLLESVWPRGEGRVRKADPNSIR